MTWKRIAGGALLAMVLVVLLLRTVDLGEVLTILRRARWPLLPFVLALSFLVIFLKAQRWSVAIASAPSDRPRKRLFAASTIGTSANFVLPARLGDLLRAFVLRKHNQVPAARALMSSWGAQSFDVLAVCLLLFAGVASGQGLASIPVLALVIVGTVLAVAVGGTLARRPQTLRRWAQRLPGRAGTTASALIDHSVAGLRFLSEPRVLTRVVAYTIAVWTVEIFAMWLALYTFQVEVGIVAAGMLVAAIGLSFALPLTPGNIGTYQLVAILVLGAFEVERDRAFAFGVGYHALTLVGTVTVGLLLFLREGLSWRDLRNPQAAAQDEIAAP